MTTAVYLLVAVAGLFWVAYRRPRPRRWLLPRRTPAVPAAGAVLAAEAVGFPNFPAALHALDSPAGRLAVRAVSRAARGCRDGVIDPAALVRAGLGDHLAAVSETAPPAADPWLTAAVLEAER